MRFSNKARKFSVFAAAFALVISTEKNASAAVEMIGFGKEKFQINLGYYRPNFSTSVSEGIKGSPLPPGDISGEDDLGLESNLGVARFDGYWRFAERHRLYFGYYQLDRDAERILPQDVGPIDIDGENVYLVSGSNIFSKSKMKVYILGYGYTFLQSETMELAGKIGLNVAQLGTKLSGTLIVSPISPSTPAEQTTKTGATSGSEVTAPLPAFGIAGDWAIDERWRMKGNLGAFQIKINNVKATVVDAGVAAEYRLLRNFGVGAGYSLLNAKAEYDKDNASASMNWRTGGWQLYGSWFF